MKPSIQSLGQILYSPSQYVIPVFQRNYRWESPQWEKLWDSLIEFQTPEKQGNHFMGFLVFVPGLPQPGQHTTFHLIDGQQRLTTCSILLAAIRNVARTLGQDLADEIHDDYLVHPRKKAIQHFRLLPKASDQETYISIVTGGGSTSGRMEQGLRYFEERLEEASSEGPQVLRAFFDTVCQRLEFMCATLEAENAYNIFKSLNSTGVPLGQADLIRNFVFMHVPPDDHDEFDERHWGPVERRFARKDNTLDEEKFSGFFRDFLMSTGRYVSPKETFSSFEARFEATGFSPRELAHELTEAASNYSVLSGAVAAEDPPVAEALAGLNALESSTTFPLLLALMSRRGERALTNEQLVRAIEMLRGFILRRFINGDTSRGYGQIFVRAIPDPDSSPVEALEAYLMARGWPDDQTFEDAFLKFPLYERSYTREVLAGLERARGHREPAQLSQAQVEHILPQTLNEAWVAMLGADAERIHAEWLHCPGNLTLSAYNQELWNHPFLRKRERYATSNIGITREISTFDHWSEEQIQKRGRALAREAAGIWVGPKERVAAIPQSNAREDRTSIRMRFWTALNDFLVEKYPDLPDFEGTPFWTMRLPTQIRHVGLELRLGLRDKLVGIDIWFWREASFPLWEEARENPADFNELVGVAWGFERTKEQARGRMFLDRSTPELRSEAAWPGAFEWIGAKLSAVYGRLLPEIRLRAQRRANLE